MKIHDTVKKKVMVTGGHVTPAIATIDALMKNHPEWQIVFVGRKTALEGDRTLSEEYRLINAKHIRFLSIIAGRLKREGGVRAFITLMKVPVGFVQAVWDVLTERPDVIVSFGGYVGLPVVAAGWILRVPIVTHEQTRRPGLANRIISRFATRTCVSFPGDTVGLHGNLIYTGLPLRESVLHPQLTSSITLPKKKRPLLLVVGGSTGARSMNTIIYEALPALLRTFTVLHQVGRISVNKSIEVRSSLIENRDHYIPIPYLSEDEYAWVLHRAKLVIGRSGANTVMEIAVVGKVALFVPLPWSAGNEQYFNALFLKEAGSAEILPQKDLSLNALVQTVTRMMDEYADRDRRAALLAVQVPHDGSLKLVRVIEELVH